MKFSTGSPCVPIGGFAALTVSDLPNKKKIVFVGITETAAFGGLYHWVLFCYISCVSVKDN